MNETTVKPFHINQQFLITVTQAMNNVSELLHDIFGIAMKFGLMDLNVLVKDENTQMWSLHFYHPFVGNCYSFEIVKIETFSPENYTNEIDLLYRDLFPTMKFKFPNCPLLISAFPFDPFTIIRSEDNGSKTYDGIDVIIVNEISETLNLNPVYMEAPDGKNRGIIFKNGTANGAIKMVEME